MSELSQENQIIDLPDLNRFRIGDHVIADATFDHDRHEGIVIGIELQRVHGTSRLTLAPSITILHDVDQITDGFLPIHLRKVDTPSPEMNVLPSTARIVEAADMVKAGKHTMNEVRAVLGLPPAPHGHEIAVEAAP